MGTPSVSDGIADRPFNLDLLCVVLLSLQVNRSSGDNLLLLYFLLDEEGAEHLAATGAVAPTDDSSSGGAGRVVTYRASFKGPPPCEPLVTTSKEELESWLDGIVRDSQAAPPPAMAAQQPRQQEQPYEWTPGDTMDVDAAAALPAAAAEADATAGIPAVAAACEGQLFFVGYRCTPLSYPASSQCSGCSRARARPIVLGVAPENLGHGLEMQSWRPCAAWSQRCMEDQH